MSKRLAVYLLLFMTTSACARNPVPVLGTSTDIAALTGEWVGEYSSGESGREGNILFKLEAGADTAHGDVMMIPLDPSFPYRPPINEFDPTIAEEYRAFLLTISWVTVEDKTVRGTLSPYKDPSCGCELETVFSGTIENDRIEGTYRSFHLGDGTVQTGYWWATRKREW